MSRSVWIVALLGFFGVGAVMILMLWTLSSLEGTPQSATLAWANSVRHATGVEALGLEVADDPLRRKRIRIRYSVRRDRPAPLLERENEMRMIASEVLKRYAGDRKEISLLEIRRRETVSRGCRRTTVDHSLTVSNAGHEGADPSSTGGRIDK